MEMAYVEIPYTETNTPINLLPAIDADRSVTLHASCGLAIGTDDDVNPYTSPTIIGFQLTGEVTFRLESGTDLWVSSGGPSCALSYIATSAE